MYCIIWQIFSLLFWKVSLHLHSTQTKQHCGSKNTSAHVHLMLCILSLEASAPSTWTRRFPSWGNWFTTRTSCRYWTGTRLRVRDVYCVHIVLLFYQCVWECFALCRALHADHGVCELWNSEDLPADQQKPPECWSWAAEPPHYRLVPHRSGYAAPALQDGNNITEC